MTKISPHLYVRCKSCASSTVNGVLIHEQGCPDAWRDTPIMCMECGCKFLPEERGEIVCLDCQAEYEDYFGDGDDEDE